MTVLPLSEVKARLSEIADEVGRTHERVHITKNGKDYVVLLAAEDLESIEATLELLSDPAAQERIAQSRDEIARGEGLSIAEVARSLEVRFVKRRPAPTRSPSLRPQLASFTTGYPKPSRGPVSNSFAGRSAKSRAEWAHPCASPSRDNGEPGAANTASATRSTTTTPSTSST